MTTAIRAPGARPKLDQICAEAVDLARDAITDDVAGPYIEAVAEGERLVTHYFECLMPAYRGWRWAVTVARVPRSKVVTVCETVLLPGPDALVAPKWVPWEDRVAPGDLGVGDLMPTPPDDQRLAPGYLLSDDPAVEDVVWELGLGRVRVMSRDGRLDTADRWYEGDHGPHAAITTAAPTNARCVSCGFYLPLAGSMRAMFGVCGNVYAPDDGRVVSGDHGCGAHSEVLIDQPDAIEESPTVYDDSELDVVDAEAAVPVDQAAQVDQAVVDEAVEAGTIEPAADVVADSTPTDETPVPEAAAVPAEEVAPTDETTAPEAVAAPTEETARAESPAVVEESAAAETSSPEAVAVPTDETARPEPAVPAEPAAADDGASPDDQAPVATATESTDTATPQEAAAPEEAATPEAEAAPAETIAEPSDDEGRQNDQA